MLNGLEVERGDVGTKVLTQGVYCQHLTYNLENVTLNGYFNLQMGAMRIPNLVDTFPILVDYKPDYFHLSLTIRRAVLLTFLFELMLKVTYKLNIIYTSHRPVLLQTLSPNLFKIIRSAFRKKYIYIIMQNLLTFFYYNLNLFMSSLNLSGKKGVKACAKMVGNYFSRGEMRKSSICFSIQ